MGFLPGFGMNAARVGDVARPRGNNLNAHSSMRVWPSLALAAGRGIFSPMWS